MRLTNIKACSNMYMEVNGTRLSFDLRSITIYDMNGTVVADINASERYLRQDNTFSVVLTKNSTYRILAVFTRYNYDGNQSLWFRLYVSPRGRMLLTVPEEIHLDGYEPHYMRLLDVLENGMLIIENMTPHPSSKGKAIGVAFSINPSAFAYKEWGIIVYGGDPNYWKEVFDNGYYLPPETWDLEELQKHTLALDTLFHEIAHVVVPPTDLEQALASYWEIMIFAYLKYMGSDYAPVLFAKLQLTYETKYGSVIAGKRSLTFFDAIYWVITGTLIDMTYSLTGLTKTGFLPEILNYTEMINKALLVTEYGRRLVAEGYGSDAINVTLVHKDSGLLLPQLFAIVPPEYRLYVYLACRERIIPLMEHPSFNYAKEHAASIYYLSVVLSNATYNDLRSFILDRNRPITLRPTFNVSGDVFVTLYTADPNLYNRSIAYFLGSVKVNEKFLPPPPSDHLNVVVKGFIEFCTDTPINATGVITVKLRDTLGLDSQIYKVDVYRYSIEEGEWVRLPSGIEEGEITFLDNIQGMHALYFYVVYNPIVTITVTETERETSTTTLSKTITETITEIKTISTTMTKIQTASPKTVTEKIVTSTIVTKKTTNTYTTTHVVTSTVTVEKEVVGRGVLAVTLLALIASVAVAVARRR